MTKDKEPRLHEKTTDKENALCYQSIVLVGPPGVGKGTQGKLLSTIPGIFHLSSGDMFRELDEQSELGQLFNDYATRGELVPDKITIKIWKDYIRNKVKHKVYTPETDLLILDGIPRNIIQAELMNPYIKVLKVLYMVCEDREVMFKRIRGRALQEKRKDDADELIVRYRRDIYEKETLPLIDHYPQELVRIIDADNIPARVLFQILSVIVPIQEDCFSPPFL